MTFGLFSVSTLEREELLLSTSCSCCSLFTALVWGINEAEDTYLSGTRSVFLWTGRFIVGLVIWFACVSVSSPEKELKCWNTHDITFLISGVLNSGTNDQILKNNEETRVYMFFRNKSATWSSVSSARKTIYSSLGLLVIYRTSAIHSHFMAVIRHISWSIQ